jgi:AraC family transcriptional regulator, transcriptional activator of pobA
MKGIPIRSIRATKESAAGKCSIRRLEDILNGHDLQHDLHRHSFFFILLVGKGEGVHEIDFTSYEVQERSIFLLRPGQVHQLLLRAGATGFLMEFDADFYHAKDKSGAQRMRRAGGKNFCLFEAGRFEKLKALLNAIFDEYTCKQEGYADAIRAMLDLFYIEFVRQGDAATALKSGGNIYIQDRFEEFNELLEKHITSEKQVSYYTRAMNLSSYQLNEITKSVAGKTASALIDDYIVLEAKRYLLATSAQVKEIADQLGYEDPSYFIRFFRKHTGHSPETFRKNFR